MASVLEMLRDHADHTPHQAAILAPQRIAASYADVAHHVEQLARGLQGCGISRRDRVAVALPNGPELAVAVLSTATAAQCAPLAIDHPRAQFARELTVLRARALLVQVGTHTAAREAAADVGVPVLELDAGAVAGSCTMATPWRPLPRPTSTPDDLDAALLLFTSGTTSDPKLVPLTQDNLLRSAATVAETLRLAPADRCLNVMPLFHIHGLVAGLLASLTAGGSVICTAGFRADSVRSWINEFTPTWYTAVPTIHQAMLDVAKSTDLRGTFRLIRSSSAALPPHVLQRLEDELGAPVIEAYGMTEAAHQMASNPLPPESRRPGTVGRATGVEIAVLDAEGCSLPAGSEGELAVKGPTVMHSYVDNPDATATAFTNGWFRTGDQGRIDADGYITITGRLKEIINRGGEKVAPREIDEALLAHRDVKHASAFAVPHPRLGEEVAAAVVLVDGARVTAAELRTFIARQLEPFKVPRRVVVVDDIPRGPTGKIERRHLASALALDRGFDSTRPGDVTVAPRDDQELHVALLWQRVLGLDVLPSVDEDFFDLGGDSLHATALLTEVEREYARPLSATIFFDGATVRGMSDALRSPMTHDPGPSIVAIHPEGSRPPLFCLLRGGSVVAARHFVPALGPDQPIYGIWYPAMHGSRRDAGSVEEIAYACRAVLQEVQSDGPFLLFGHSFGGLVMYEVARQLRHEGEAVGFLALADTAHPRFVVAAWRRRAYHLRRWMRRAVMTRTFRRRPTARGGIDLGAGVRLDLYAVWARERKYRPEPADWPVAIFATEELQDYGRGPDLGWASLLTEWTSDPIPGSHDSMLGEPHVHVLAAKLAERLRAAQAEPHSER